MPEQLNFRKQMRDGRVLAVNVWATGFQELVYPTRAAFDAAKVRVETTGTAPAVGGFTSVD